MDLGAHNLIPAKYDPMSLPRITNHLTRESSDSIASGADNISLDGIQVTLDSDVPKLLQGEMKKLESATRSVEIGFREISSSLSVSSPRIVLRKETRPQLTPADRQTRPQSPSNDTRPQFPSADRQMGLGWSDYYNLYVELLWTSRRISGSARAVAKDFAGNLLDVIKNPTYSIEEKKREFAVYRKDLQVRMNDAEELLHRFDKLNEAVDRFKHNISTFIRRDDAAARELLDEVETTNPGLAQAKMLAIHDTANALGVKFVVGGVIAIGTLCPLLWLKSVSLSGRDAAKVDERWEKYVELFEDRVWMQEGLMKYQDGRTINRTTATLISIHHDLHFIREKIANITQIWHFISFDLDAIEQGLEQESSEQKALFQMELDVVSNAYRALAYALRAYETNANEGSPWKRNWTRS